MMSRDFPEKIEKYIEKNHLLMGSENVVLGVSGGADSTALLLVLDSLKEKLNLKLYVVCVDHGIRTEAKEEAKFVENLCKDRGIPFSLFKADIPKIAKEQSLGEEEAGRKIRYEAFNKKLKEIGGGLIAVAHNKNDRAETMLFNLFRGTGPKGLQSIDPKRDNIIRPLLCVERKEIEEFLESENVSFCIDKSNLSNVYSRNKIRNIVLPAIEDNISKKAVEHMAVTIDQLSMLNAFAQRECEKSFSDCATVTEGKVVFNKEKLLLCDAYIRKLLIKRAIDELVPNNKDITHIHIESVLSLLEKEGYKALNLPYLIKAESAYSELSLSVNRSDEEADFEKPLILDEVISDCLGFDVKASLINEVESLDLGENQYTKYFDYDKINGSLFLRNKRTKDEIVINSSGGKKKLKDYMIDMKIPANKRSNVLLLASGNNIIWVIGFRISEMAKVTKETKRVLKVTVYPKEV